MSLEIETGRFTPIYDKTLKKNRKRIPSERICKLCDLGVCEDEVHFVLICTKYEDIRKAILDPILKYVNCLSLNDKLKMLMQSYQPDLMTYISQAWNCRQKDKISL